MDRRGDARTDEQRKCPISRGQSVIGERRPHTGPFPGVEVPWNVLGRRASIHDMRGIRVWRQSERQRRGRGRRGDIRLTDTLKLMT